MLRFLQLLTFRRIGFADGDLLSLIRFAHTSCRC